MEVRKLAPAVRARQVRQWEPLRHSGLSKNLFIMRFPSRHETSKSSQDSQVGHEIS